MFDVHNFIKAALVLSFAGSQISAQCAPQYHPVLHDGEVATGVSIAPDGKTIALSSGEPTDGGFHGRIRLLDSDDIGAHNTALLLNDGIVPHDPDYDPTGQKIAYAGFCKHENLPCWETAPGWNIFSLDLKTGETTLETLPNAGYLSWRPKYGPDGSLFFVGVIYDKSLDAFYGSVIAPSSVFKITPHGEARAILPTLTTVPHGFSYRNPVGNFSQLELLAVHDDHIVVEGVFNASAYYPKRTLEIMKRDGERFDERMLDLADRVFYSNPVEVSKWIGTRTYRTIFFATPEKVTSLDEREFIGDAPPRYVNSNYAIADERSLWVAFATMKHHPNELFQFEGDNVHFIRDIHPIPFGSLRAKDRNGDLMVYLFQLKNRDSILHINRGKGGIANYFIQEDRNAC